MRTFEFDIGKSSHNLEKHGIDFITAKKLWDDVNFVEISARTTDEPRYLVIGMIDHKHWSAVITYRDECIRIISVRRSRELEILIYES
jgi:uncharacterized protein